MFDTLVVLGAGVVFGLAAVAVARAAALRVGLVDRPDGRRKLQARPVAVAGGVGVLVATVAALAVTGAFLPDVGRALFEDALPAFVTVVLIPLTLSITQGILWGFLLHALLYTVAGRWREVGPMLWLLSLLSAGLLLLGH